MSAGSTTWRWARWCRPSVGPLARRAASIASSASRTARSPRAWKWTWNPAGVEPGHVPLEGLGVDEADAAVRRSARPCAVEVRLEHRRPCSSRHPVLHDLHGRRPQPADRGCGRALDHLVDLLGAPLALPPVAGDRPAGQTARARRTSRYAARSGGRDPGVLPGRDPEPVQVRLGQLEPAGRAPRSVGGGMSRSTSSIAPSWRVPLGLAVRVALDAAVGRVGRVVGDPGRARAPGC